MCSSTAASPVAFDIKSITSDLPMRPASSAESATSGVDTLKPVCAAPFFISLRMMGNKSSSINLYFACAALRTFIKLIISPIFSRSTCTFWRWGCSLRNMICPSCVASLSSNASAARIAVKQVASETGDAVMIGMAKKLFRLAGNKSRERPAMPR